MKKILIIILGLIGFAQAQVNVAGYIQTNGVASYPTHIDSMGKGGYVVVYDTTQRNSITCLRRKFGMAVYTQKDTTLWILRDSSCNNNWIAFTSGISSVDTNIISTKAYVNYKDDIQQGYIDMRKLESDSIAWTGYATIARLYKVSDSISDKLNNKLNASAVSIGAGQVAFGSGTNTIGGDNGLYWDNTNKRLGIGNKTPTSALTISGDITPSINMTHNIGAVGKVFSNAYINTISMGSSSYVNWYSAYLVGGAAYGEIFLNTGGASYIGSQDGSISRLGIANSNPTARLHLPRNQSIAGYANIKFSLASAALLSTKERGAFEAVYDRLYFTDSTNTRNTLAYISDVAAKQNTITGAATTITTSNLTANRALISDGSGKVAVSAVTDTELGYVGGVTSNIQTQLNAKLTTANSNVKRYIIVDSTTYSGNYAMDGTKEVILINYAAPCGVTLPVVSGLPDGSVFEIQFYNWGATGKTIDIYSEGGNSEEIDAGLGIASPRPKITFRSDNQATTVTPLSLRIMWLAEDNVWTVLQGGVLFDY